MATKTKTSEQENEKAAETDQSKYGTFEPTTFERQESQHADSADLWVSFARKNPQEFLKLITDDFAGLRLVQALFVNAVVGLARSAMGKRANHAAQLCGGFAGLSLFCNLFGIIMSIVVSSQCSGMKSMKASGEQVVAAIPKLFKLFYVTMISFVVGMISMAAGVIALLSTSQTWAVCIFLCILSIILLAILLGVMTTYAFGTSVISHSATLALHTVHSDLETAGSLGQKGFDAVGGAADSARHAAEHAATHWRRQASAIHGKSEETTSAESSTKPTEKAAAPTAAAGP